MKKFLGLLIMMAGIILILGTIRAVDIGNVRFFQAVIQIGLGTLLIAIVGFLSKPTDYDDWE